MLQPLFALGSLALAGALLFPTSTVKAPTLSDGAFRVDPVHSSALFSTIHFGASRFYGRFNEVGGSIEFDPAKPGDSKITIVIEMASVDTHDKKRDQHLRGPDFFAAKEFPTMTFISKSVKVVKPAATDQPLTLEVTGEVELAGKKKSLTVRVEQVGAGQGMGGAELIGFETHFTLTRSDFGIDYMVGPIGDEVEVILSLEAGR